MTGVEGRSLSPWDWSPSLARRACGSGAGSSRRRGGFRHTCSIPSTNGREGGNSWALPAAGGQQAAAQAGNRQQHKLTHGRLRLDLRSLFTRRTTNWWDWRPSPQTGDQRGWTISISGDFMSQLDQPLSSLFWGDSRACSVQGLRLETSLGLCQTSRWEPLME